MAMKDRKLFCTEELVMQSYDSKIEISRLLTCHVGDPMIAFHTRMIDSKREGDVMNLNKCHMPVLTLYHEYGEFV